MTLGTNMGSEILSAGDQYSMRAAATFVQMSKRTTSATGGGSHIQVKANTTVHLDGNWHHLAGVATPAGMKIYMDGALLATLEPTATDPRAGNDVRYDRSNDFWVARHGGNGNAYDFNGEIDDVRVYSHPMTDSDVAWLASGKP
jgi:Concanavalin A-like lectin/glucanases superfamily